MAAIFRMKESQGRLVYWFREAERTSGIGGTLKPVSSLAKGELLQIAKPGHIPESSLHFVCLSLCAHGPGVLIG